MPSPLPFCDWIDTDDRWKCARCGAEVAKAASEKKPFAVCATGSELLSLEYRPAVRVDNSNVFPHPVEGPGTELKKLLRKAGIAASGGCQCNARAIQMNRWGPDECERRLDDIVKWLRDEAAGRGLPFVDAVGRILVRRAIKNARKLALPKNATG